MKNIQKTLEAYIEGKDQDKFKILEDIYLPTAQLEFQINSSAISFPTKTLGNKNIGQVLSAQFNKKYDNVKTYYLSNNLPSEGKTPIITKQKWLVLMREKNSGQVKIGSGFYNWFFEKQKDNTFKISKHIISIGVMISLENFPLSFLQELQNQLTYPWTDENTVKNTLMNHKELKEVFEYINS